MAICRNYGAVILWGIGSFPGLPLHCRPALSVRCRAPLLLSNPDTRKHLAANGFLYDSSIEDTVPSGVSKRVTQRLWPYNMSSGIPQSCNTGARTAPSGSGCAGSARHVCPARLHRTGLTPAADSQPHAACLVPTSHEHLGGPPPVACVLLQGTASPMSGTT